MKKNVLVLMAAMLSTAAFAQFSVAPKVDNMDIPVLPTKDGPVLHWEQIATPFVANDLRDDTEISLQSYLDEGKFVVIDYSACWCGPCWNLHRSGLLEQLNTYEDFQVIWVESERSNSIEQIYGTSGSGSAGATWGDWTVNASGEPIPFPMIDDDAAGTCNATCASLNDNYVPLLILVAPNGMACNLRGYFAYNAVAQSIQLIQMIAENYPREGAAPNCLVSGGSRVMAGGSLTFEATYSSYDPVSSVSWSCEGATPSSGTGESFSCTFPTAGNYEVVLSVTNAGGTATVTHNVEAYVMPAGVLSYTYEEATSDDSGIGTGNNTRIYWAVTFPPTLLANMSNVNSVDCWVSQNYPGDYTMKICSGTATAPSDVLAQVTVSVSAADAGQYVTFNPPAPVAVDPSKTLWIVMDAIGAYPAMGVEYVGDPNSDWVSTNGRSWMHAYADNDLPYSWLITAYSSAVGVDDVQSAARVSVYPNPATDRVKVDAEGLRLVEVLDLEGRVLMANSTSSSIDMSALSTGVYMFRITTESGVSLQKVIKK